VIPRSEHPESDGRFSVHAVGIDGENSAFQAVKDGKIAATFKDLWYRLVRGGSFSRPIFAGLILGNPFGLL
jgi:hypothetical protein